MLFEKEVDRRMHQTVDDGGHGEDSTDDSHNSHEQLMPLFIFHNCEDSDRVGLISAIRGYIPEEDHRCRSKDHLVHSDGVEVSFLLFLRCLVKGVSFHDVQEISV